MKRGIHLNHWENPLRLRLSYRIADRHEWLHASARARAGMVDLARELRVWLRYELLCHA